MCVYVHICTHTYIHRHTYTHFWFQDMKHSLSREIMCQWQNLQLRLTLPSLSLSQFSVYNHKMLWKTAFFCLEIPIMFTISRKLQGKSLKLQLKNLAMKIERCALAIFYHFTQSFLSLLSFSCAVLSPLYLI